MGRLWVDFDSAKKFTVYKLNSGGVLNVVGSFLAFCNPNFFKCQDLFTLY